MKCTEIHNHIDNYLDNALSADELNAVEIHIDRCTSCHQLLDESKAIRHALLTLPVENASPGFEEKMFKSVGDHYGKDAERSGNRYLAGLTTAIAAGFVLWFVSTMYVPQLDNTSHNVVNLAMSQVRTVRLLFEAPTDLNDVTLSVMLPENVELEGYAGQTQIVWQTNLNRGKNILALPVTAIDHGQGNLVAQLNYGDKTKQFHIVVKTSSDGAIIYQINQFKSA